MMNFKCLIAAIVVATSAAGQDDHMNISGKIVQPNPNYLLISPMVLGATPDTIPIAADGSFEYSIPLKEATFFHIYNGANKVEMFLGPEHDIEIKFGQQWWYTGDISLRGDAGYNTFLFNQKEWNPQAKNIERQNVFSLQPMDFFFYMDSVIAIHDAALESMADSIKKVDENFLAIQRALDNYWKAELLLTYTLVPKDISGTDTTYYNNYYLEFFNALPLDQPAVILFENYYNFLVRYIDNTVRNQMSVDPTISTTLGGPYWATFNVINSLELDQNTKNFMYFRTIEPLLTKGAVQDVVDLLPQFQEYCTDDNMNQTVAAYYNYWMQPLIGSDVPEMGFVNIEGEAVSLDQFKGKYIYIDVWATWCGPCKKEIPYLKTLGAELEGKNIVFLGVSTDQDKTKWENYLGSNEMHGEQVHTGSGNTISSHFQVSSIPRFIIIDPDGKVYNPRAPRPSNQATKYYLLGLDGI